ncbi:MAG: Ig-like domain repeat protein [Spirochaetales bacterium]|nr:Ig-like domain repeat protein [Spirochaetales bacterium]
MKIMRGLVMMSLFVFVVLGGLFAAGKTEAPELPPVTSGTQYLSPNGDGVQDTAVLSFTVRLYVKSDQGYVPGYGLTITSPEGEVVYEEKETETSDIGWFASIFRGFDLFELERSVSWDGTDQEGKVAPDGEYSVTITVQDAKKNVSTIDVDSFVVDTNPPRVDFKPPEDTLFAPNGDGNRDVFIVLQENGTSEDLWKGVITDETGKTVRTFSWENSAPEDLLWDGTDDGGNLLPDGEYGYSLTSTDRSGNVSDSYVVEDIVLNAKTPVLTVDLDMESFSPNGDGVQDAVTLTPVYENPEEVVSWRWNLRQGEEVVLTDEGEGAPPETLLLDGFGPQGAPIPDGMYTLSFGLAYKNAYNPRVEKDLKVDTRSPEIAVEKRTVVFSPDGDGEKDSAEIRFTSNERVVWVAAMLDMNGEIVYNLDSTETTTLVVWDGMDNGGNPLDDGKYVLVGEFRDTAGNFQYVDPIILTLDTSPVEASLSVPKGFSPNDDGKDDTIDIAIDSNRYTDVEWWRIIIRNEAGEEVYSFGGQKEMPESVAWDGRFGTEKGAGPASEGLYRAELDARYTKGNIVSDESFFFGLDRNPPKVTIAVSTDPFEQTEEGVEGNVYVSVNVEDGEGDIDSWTMDILDKDGEVLRSYSGEGDPSGDITWNTGMNGEPFPLSDSYTLVLVVTDRGGNQTEFTESVPIDILVVRKNGKLFLMVPNIIFGAYKHGLDSAGPALADRNMESIRQVAEIWKKYPRYTLGLEAHALNIYLGKPREKAEEDILFPLTERRAESVRKVLIEQGVPAERITSQAYGGQEPIVSVTDSSIWWKNRRVEFIMIPPEAAPEEEN